MNIRLWAVLALLASLVLAGCSFKSTSNDGGSDTTLSAGDNKDNKDSPSASIGAVLSVVAVALLVRRRMEG
jgi:hypothetical protein